MPDEYAKVTVICPKAILPTFYQVTAILRAHKVNNPQPCLAFSDSADLLAWYIPDATYELAQLLLSTVSQLKSGWAPHAVYELEAPIRIGVFVDYLRATEGMPIWVKHEEVLYRNNAATTPYITPYIANTHDNPVRGFEAVCSYRDSLQLGYGCYEAFLVSDATLLLSKSAQMTALLLDTPLDMHPIPGCALPYQFVDCGLDFIWDKQSRLYFQDVLLPSLLALPEGQFTLLLRTKNGGTACFGSLQDHPAAIIRTVYHLGRPVHCQYNTRQLSTLEQLVQVLDESYALPF